MHLEILGFSMGGAYLFRDIFVQFKTIRRKQNLTTALGIQMKIGGNLAFFRDNKASICKKKRHALLCILQLLRITIA